MANIQLWVVTSDSARSNRWEKVLKRAGWLAAASDMDGLLRAPETRRPGIALIDAPILGPFAAESIRELKARLPALSLILISVAPLPNDLIVSALEAGVDDYLHDSLDSRLILAKLSSHLRRLLPGLTASFDAGAESSAVRINKLRHQVEIKGPRNRWTTIAEVTPTEFSLLSLFLERPGVVLERSFLLETIWGGRSEGVLLGTVDKHIESLRRKLGAKGDLIKTVYGAGYVFKEDGA